MKSSNSLKSKVNGISGEKKKHFFILFLIHSSLYLLEELLEISRYNDIPMASVVVFVIVVTVNMPVYQLFWLRVLIQYLTLKGLVVEVVLTDTCDQLQAVQFRVISFYMLFLKSFRNRTVTHFLSKKI